MQTKRYTLAGPGRFTDIKYNRAGPGWTYSQKNIPGTGRTYKKKWTGPHKKIDRTGPIKRKMDLAGPQILGLCRPLVLNYTKNKAKFTDVALIIYYIWILMILFLLTNDNFFLNDLWSVWISGNNWWLLSKLIILFKTGDNFILVTSKVTLTFSFNLILQYNKIPSRNWIT